MYNQYQRLTRFILFYFFKKSWHSSCSVTIIFFQSTLKVNKNKYNRTTVDSQVEQKMK